MGINVPAGMRSVASYDEDTATMGVEAARNALLPLEEDTKPTALWFSSSNPPYMDKTNANVIHAALRLDKHTGAYDFGGAEKSGVGALKSALNSTETLLLVQSDVRSGLPSSEDEIYGGDAASAMLIGSEDDGPLIARYLGGASTSEEFIDRWRDPSETHTKSWEERFVVSQYLQLIDSAWKQALATTSLTLEQISTVVISGSNKRVKNQIAKSLEATNVRGDLFESVGIAGAADATLLLTHALETSQSGEIIALIVLSDGIEILIFEAGEIRNQHPATISSQLNSRDEITYQRFLQWKGNLKVQPPNRPAPSRISASAAARESEWKHGFVASKGDESGLVHMPPARVSASPEDQIDAMSSISMANTSGHVVTYTIDRLVYSESPPVVFAVVDFVGGGRMPIEITDVDSDNVSIGMEVIPTFRKVFTADSIHNYFWKVRPKRI
ncbi:MAG: hydroxymethylglutaryl-CoA synthase [Acidimicrobiaceae bacterium]|nr:hydroxymethylglutaryl-CoA synthase [Acidimicrobiaceae bacterium]|tara:strand:+ start:332 stop:1660 length:1329 start_codon:yes stop_codon:yes gene_type:complete